MKRDTRPEVDARYHAMWAAMPAEERVAKGCAMFDAAKEIILASLRAELGERATPERLRRELVIRLYGRELSPETIERFLRERG